MSLYEGLKTRIKVVSEFSEFYVEIGVHQGPVLLPVLFAIPMYVVAENAREGLMKEVLYANDLVLMSETMEDLKKRFLKWRSALESKRLKVKFEKTKVMVCGLEGETIWSRIDGDGLTKRGPGARKVRGALFSVLKKVAEAIFSI